MNTVTFQRDSNGLIKAFRSAGHVGYGDKGEDIVCAGISALVINSVNSIERLTESDIVVTSDEEEGVIDCVISDYESDDVQLLLSSLNLGVTQIQKRYGEKFIRIEMKEV
ncbi:MAG: ribosomal-processing cysteine protease Prp [Eubacterium sp.]|nr:ribosomal-processing cysteine protease Prp [Eubacterium sp.]